MSDVRGSIATDRPMRGTPFTPGRLFESARTLSRTFEYSTEAGPKVTPLLALVDGAAEVLDDFNTTMSRAAQQKQPIPSASEWLLDNYYLIHEQVLRVREDLPRSYGAELPHMTAEPCTGFPRIYPLMVELIEHTDARLDREHLHRFVMAFQEGSALTIGEVWALPIMLRAALLENLRRLATLVRRAYEDDRRAKWWADELLRSILEEPAGLASRLDRLSEECDRSSPAFFIRIHQRLLTVDAPAVPVTEWLDRRIVALGTTMEALRTAEHHRQAANQVSIANSVTSIRFLNALDWHGFFESVNAVEAILHKDPAGVYAHMDFLTRDRYRDAVEGLAKRCPASETEVAHATVERARKSRESGAVDPVEGHVGWYLVTEGRYDFERSLRYRPSRRERLYRGPLENGGVVFWGLFAILVATLTASVCRYALVVGAGVWGAAWLGLLAVLPLSEIALTIANRTCAVMWPPRPLPSLDLRRPLQKGQRTLVTMPALVTSPEAARDAVYRLEIHYLTGNQDPNIHLALLCERRGSPTETLPEDQDILEAAVEAVGKLNDRHERRGSRPFHVFARRRVQSRSEGEWMGWERKRGALFELTRLLRGATDTTFVMHEGDDAFLEDVAFVLTLDADTSLSRDGARRLISIISHPLNRARIDLDTRRVIRGYGLIQPRVSISLPSAGKTYFSWMHTGVIGIDPYGGAVSDVYQDVFGEGSFTGKAIYDVDVFLTVLESRIPENRLVSHDLLEGNYLRTGLASDVEVFDDYPANYATFAARTHRWVRGDWQVLPWLMPKVPAAGSGFARNDLSLLHRWKLLDNLRRSLTSPALLAMIVTGWVVLPANDPVWPLIIAGVLFYPAIMQFVDALLTRPKGVSARRALHSLFEDLRRDVTRALFAASVLPHDAWIKTDAIVRALYRTFVSRRKILEWTTAAATERRLSLSLRDHIRRMGPAAVTGAVLLAPELAARPGHRALMLPLLLLWIGSPAVAYVASRSRRRMRQRPASEKDRLAMRRIARRTWRFFEVFVTEEDHWLVPDNFQEDPKGEAATRTSPTNIGLQLLSYLTAYDLGYVGLPELVDRTSATLSTLAGLPRFRGHFYNWYDTRTLETLPPGYISTVDSGNLAGHLLVLRMGLFEASEGPILSPSVLTGLADTARAAMEDGRWTESPGDFLETLSDLEAPTHLGEWSATLRRLEESTAPKEMQPLEDLIGEVDRHVETLRTYAPWAPLLEDIPEEILRSVEVEALRPLLEQVPSLVGLTQGLKDVVEALDRLASQAGRNNVESDPAARWARAVADGIAAARPAASTLLARLRLMADIAQEVWEHTDFRMLYDPARKLFSIGFNTAEGRLDSSYYDMLASECRLASFLAVAKGDVPQSHWFRLGRGITTTHEGYALLSWSGSMFEYLMPLLIMRSWPDTLLDETYYTVVKRQIEYARQAGVPWGVSESAFNAKDADLHYQYRAFGVPGLGLKRGLSDDVVVAPYATLLALQIDAGSALANLEALAARGGEGDFGFFEAIDYTPGRIPAGEERAIVRTYMAHHQAMSLVALGNHLTDYAMRRRFHSDPLVRSAEVLLQERTPRHVYAEHPFVEEVRFVRSVRELPPPVTRSYPGPHTPTPSTHFLSNGSYSVMVTNAGGGYSCWRGLDISRYREDVTRDCWGTFIYVRDRDSGEVWSAAYQPTLVEPDDYHVTFSAEKAAFRRRDGTIETYLEILVSPEDDAEVRRVTLTNHGREARDLEVTSYFEVSLAPHQTDQAHRTFSNLFVQTERLDDACALLFTRRPQSSLEQPLWGFHVLACEAQDEDGNTCETDRARFLGRLRQPNDALAVELGGDLSGTTGAVLDPICAIRRRVTIEPGDTARLAYTTGIARTRDGAVTLAEQYRDIRSAQQALDLAWTSSHIVLRDLGISAEDAIVYQRLASRLLLTDPYSPLKIKTAKENGLPLSSLWSLGISGDLPILLVKIERVEGAPIVRQALLAHQYWRHTGLEVDLVILNTRPSAYSDELQDRLSMLLRTGHALELMDKPGGVFLRQADQMSADVRNLLESVARAVVDADRGSLLFQLNLRGQPPESPFSFVKQRPAEEYAPLPFERPELEFDNGSGGFDAGQSEYVIVLEDGKPTPAPWVNVMSNSAEFGSMISEAGIGCTWAVNSHENRLTTWNNDPVSDGSGECLYIRDEETGEFWSPTPLPIREEGTYVIRHGRGYSRFSHDGHGISHDLCVFVPPDDPVRVAWLRLTNHSRRRRILSVVQFVEWSLGESRSRAQQRVVTWYDADADMLTAHNHFNIDFSGRTTFLTSDRPMETYTGSRTEFLGRNGHPVDPAAMHRAGLGGRTGRFHDACGAVLVRVPVDPGQTVSVAFFLGQTETLAQTRDLVARLRSPGALEDAFTRTRKAWDGLLDTVRVRTPDRSLDLLLNGPLLYQALACRIWGRMALYQSSGAYGFRDQLQDSLAFLLCAPHITRERIVEAARHQFPEGDVLHWWMPVSGRGVRTRISDDRHWLPYVVAEYVRATGDTTVLDEKIPFIEGTPLEPEQKDEYLEPSTSGRVVTVYEHCVAALETAESTGPHGLPLMGGGDWNDSMNRVGIGGVGESVWLAWFLDVTLRRFADVCEARGDADQAESYREQAASLVEAVEGEAWDGEWYRRAYFDDGAALGSSDSQECRIDAIAQAWASISGMGDPVRADQALESVGRHLVVSDDRLIKLLDPPFDRTSHDPGYIKGYVPGVRENGGQYTHGALWVALAHFLRGDADEGHRLLDMLNPITHALTPLAADVYRVEPYVVAADVYAAAPHRGRGGWTWYTGAAGWFYQVAVGHLLGLRPHAEEGRHFLEIEPCIPHGWSGFEVEYRYGRARYHITVDNSSGAGGGPSRIGVDGKPAEGTRIPLDDDGRLHEVLVVLGG